MIFTITKSSIWDYKDEKTFNTLEELMNWVKEIKENIIIKWDENEIEIYDYYRE